jgi:glycosyltransferase involved in cell wall biosynthesis
MRDDRIQLFSKKHTGYVPWLNEGITISRGEFIARMDADDISFPDRFARQLEYLRKNLSCSAVGCGILLIDPDGSPLCKRIFEGDHDKLDARQLMGEFPAIAHPASMMRRSLLIKAGGYRELYESMEEFDLWLRLAEHGRLANLPEVLFKYRQHHESVNATQVERQKRWADHIINEARLRRGFEPLSRSIWNNCASVTSTIERHLDWAMSAAASGYRKTAFKHAFIALGKGPLYLKAWAVFMRCFVPNEIMSLLKRLGFSRVWDKWNGRLVNK